jgi:hypothetical protein
MTFSVFRIASACFDTEGGGAAVSASTEAPTTESIVAEAAAGLSDREGGDADASAPDAAPDPAPVADATSTAPAAPADVDPLAAELGLKPGARDNRIPYSRVQKIVTKAQERHAAEIAQHTARIQQFEQERATYQAQMQALRVAEENPEQFLRAMAEADPRYGQLLASALQQKQAATGQPAATEKPQPDVLNGDGTLAYSLEGLERLAEWKADQRVRALEQRYEQRFGPIERDYRAQAQLNAAIPRVQAQIAEAQTWPLFEESKAEITAALQSDRSLSLDAAYRKVVFPKIQSNRDAMRAEILAEINRKPAAASGVVSGSAPAAASGPMTTEDIVRAAAAQLRSR